MRVRDRLGRACAAEWVKARTLPAVSACAAGTVALAALIAGAVAASDTGASAPGLVAATVTYAQAGYILLGALLVGSEYAGNQIRTSLVAVPDRAVVLAAKTLVFLVIAAATGVIALTAGWAAARMAGEAPGLRTLAGAGAYLLAIGLLAFWAAVALRSVIPPLVVMLAVVLIVSPLVANATEHAQWLPDRAGAALYSPGPGATPHGGLVLLGWIAVVGAVGTVSFLRSDA